MTVFNLARPVRLALSGGMSINAPAGLTFETGAVATTGFTLSGATSGYTNAAVTYTVTPYPIGSALTSTVVVSYYEDPTPTSVPILRGTLTFAAGATAAQTFQVTRTTDGTSSVSIQSALAEIGSPISLTTTTAGAGTGDLPTNSITASAVTVSSYGQAFKQGALGAGQSLASRQINPITYWPADGSVKHAIVSRQIGAGTTSDALAIGTAASGATLTLSDLVTVLTSVSFTSGGTYGTATFSTADLQSSFDWQGGASTSRAWASGPLMSSWIFRKPFSGDTHLVAWMEVRLYRPSAGPLQVEVFPWVENCYLLVANPTAKNATYTFAMNGSTRFSGAIDIKHHTRVALVNTSTAEGSSTTFSHWLGSDPAGRCIHDGAYLMATKVVPNYGWGAPDATYIDSYAQDFQPNTLAGDSNASGNAGGNGDVISARGVMYLTTSGSLAGWRAMMSHAISSGSWSGHFRDDASNFPINFSSTSPARTQIRVRYGPGTPTVPTAPNDQVPGAGDGPTMTHMPGYAYLPFLTTGRWWFLEELHFWATYGIGGLDPSRRGNGDGIIDSSQSRYRAWTLNALAQSAAATPQSHPLRSHFVTMWENNVSRHRAKYVDGTYTADGAYVSPQGFMGEYGDNSPYPPPNPSNAWWGAAWMNNYLSVVFGYSSDIGIPQSAQGASDHTAVRNQAYKQQIQRAADGAGSNYNWRRFIQYGYPVGEDATGFPPETWYTAAQSYAELMSGLGLSALPANYGLTLKDHAGANDMHGASSSLPYAVSGLAALALATEHGAPSASDGYGRVTAAGNYTTSFDGYLRNGSNSGGTGRGNNGPAWAVKPRAPSWLPALGAAADLTTNTTNQAAGRTTAFSGSYSGCAWAPWWGRYGSMIVGGGGHGDGEQNDMYRIDVETRLISQIKPAAASYVKSAGTWANQNAYCTNSTINDPAANGWMWTNTTPGDMTVQVGEPFTPHWYSMFVCLPPGAIAGSGNEVNGWLYTAARLAAPLGGSAGTYAAHKFALGASTVWAIHGSIGDSNHRAGPYPSIYDPIRNRVWHQNETLPHDSFRYRDLSTGGYGTLSYTGGTNGDGIGYYMAGEWDHASGTAIIFGDSGISVALAVFDPAAAVRYNPTITNPGSAPAMSSRSAYGYSEKWRACFYYPGTGGNTFYFLRCNGSDPRTSTWTWSQQTVSGTVYAQPGNRAYNRLRHCWQLGNMLIWHANDTQPTQIIHVSAP